MKNEPVNYGIFTEVNPLRISKTGYEEALKRRPDMKNDIQETIARGIIVIEP